MRVFVRVRPLLIHELKNPHPHQVVAAVSDDKKSVFITENPSVSSFQCFSFDRVFDPHASATEIFSHVEPLVSAALQGDSATIIAYGQGGTGRSYTINGAPHIAGLLPLALDSIFHAVDMEEYAPTVKVSWYQIHNEVISDLLRPGHSHLQVRDDKRKGTTVAGLAELVVSSTEEVIEIMNNVRKESSRKAHTFFNVHIEKPGVPGNTRSGSPVTPSVKEGTITFAIIGATDNIVKGKGAHQHEEPPSWMPVIKTVVSSLEKKQPSIPFHKSKLTLCLKSALCSNDNTVMISTISPGLDCVAGTLSNLKFSSRCRLVPSRSIKPAQPRERSNQPRSVESGREATPPQSYQDHLNHSNASYSVPETLQNLPTTSATDVFPSPTTHQTHVTPAHNIAIASPPSVSATSANAAHSNRRMQSVTKPTQSSASRNKAVSVAASTGRERTKPSVSFSASPGYHTSVVNVSGDADAAARHEVTIERRERGIPRMDQHGGDFVLEGAPEVAENSEMDAVELDEDGNEHRPRIESANPTLEHPDTDVDGLDINSSDPDMIGLRERLQKAQIDIKDYKVYKDVMEMAVKRMQTDMEKIDSERTTLRHELRGKESELERDRREHEELQRELRRALKKAELVEEERGKWKRETATQLQEVRSENVHLKSRMENIFDELQKSYDEVSALSQKLSELTNEKDLEKRRMESVIATLREELGTTQAQLRTESARASGLAADAQKREAELTQLRHMETKLSQELDATVAQENNLRVQLATIRQDNATNPSTKDQMIRQMEAREVELVHSLNEKAATLRSTEMINAELRKQVLDLQVNVQKAREGQADAERHATIARNSPTARLNVDERKELNELREEVDRLRQQK